MYSSNSNSNYTNYNNYNYPKNKDTKVVLKEFSSKLDYIQNKNDHYYNQSKQFYFKKELQNTHIKFMLNKKEEVEIHNTKKANIKNGDIRSFNFLVTPHLCRSHSSTVYKKKDK